MCMLYMYLSCELLKLKGPSLLSHPSDYPTITIPPTNRMLLPDEEADSFTCEAVGSPITTIQWYHNQQRIDQGPNYVINSTSLGGGNIYSELTIMNGPSVDGGEVKCEAITSFVDESGLARNLTTTATAVFMVLGK